MHLLIKYLYQLNIIVINLTLLFLLLIQSITNNKNFQARMENYNNRTVIIGVAEREVRLMHFTPKCNLAIPRHDPTHNTVRIISRDIHADVGVQESERAVLETPVDVSDMFGAGRGS